MDKVLEQPGSLICMSIDNEPAKRVVEPIEILAEYGLMANNDGWYWQVGEITRTQGWILHISVSEYHLNNLLKATLPFLIERKVGFKVISNFSMAQMLLSGNLGYEKLGKVLCVFQENESELLPFARELVSLTTPFKGPDVPTDRYLGGCLYTRYGSFHPVLRKGPDGQDIRYICTPGNELIPDRYHIPFLLPDGIAWPFAELAAPGAPPQPPTFTNRYQYRPLAILKPDAKGRVIKGLYIKGLFRIKPCIIKEGKKYMWLDEAGRDIRDRLKWQMELHNDLAEDIPLPKIIDAFSDRDDFLLVMEFINGKSLQETVEGIYLERAWLDLRENQKLKLLNYLLRVLIIIERLHLRGYVHRDITPANFLINKRDQIYLIDMELSYSRKKQKPVPPYTLGTPGFMSPEQLKVSRMPMVTEDIYGIGALMTVFFTGLPIGKFDVADEMSIEKNIRFFCELEEIPRLIALCLSVHPSYRPELKEILIKTEKLKHQPAPANGITLSGMTGTDIEAQRQLLERAIKGLSTEQFMSKDGIWLSRVQIDLSIRNEQRARSYSCGLHTGVSGVMYLLAKAALLGFKLGDSEFGYRASWEYLLKNFFLGKGPLKPGLYMGSGGIGIAIAMGLRSGLLEDNSVVRNCMSRCFETDPISLDLANGISGQGIALLECAGYLDKEFVNATIGRYVSDILSQQGREGEWMSVLVPKHAINSFSLSKGLCGIVYFLGRQYRLRPSIEVKKASIKALEFISKHQPRKVEKTFDTQLFSGMTGIAHTYRLAGSVFELADYRRRADDILLRIDPKILKVDYTLAWGLAGLGEAYLSANRESESKEWYRRAEWIRSVFSHTGLGLKEGLAYWSMDSMNTRVPDLMNGSCGIIHFLLHCLYPDLLNMPILE